MSFTGGKLNLKGGAPLPGVEKKKKRKKADKGEHAATALALVEDEEGAAAGGSKAARPPPPDTRTDAQRRHDEAMAAREAARIRELAAKSHRERVAEFNDKLAAMSEHHDIPKVGPG